MAQGRPLCRHEKYDSCVGMSILEAESKEFYKNSQHFSSRNTFPKPHVTQANSSEDYHYSHLSSHELVVPTQYMSRQDKDRNIPGHHMSPGSSKKQFEHSRQGQALSTYEVSYHRLQNMTYNQPRPPISSGPPANSGRPSSASFRSQSTRQQNSRQGTVHVSSEDFPDKSVMRPPSSLSKYQPLPAIGSPAPTVKMDDTSTSHLPNIIKKSPVNQQVLQQYKESEISQPLQHSKISSNRIKDTSRISAKEADLAAWSDSPALSSLTQFKTSTQGNSGVTSVEKLVMSHTDKLEAGWKGKTIHNNHFKSKETLHNNIKKNPSHLYDGDDDDSDSTPSLSKHGSSIYNRPQSATKSLVVIPSVDNPPSREILLAVKLPTDGTRHHKHFHSNEPLQSIVEFAEQIAGIQFNGYVLVVASAPKTVFVDLEDTIENAGLEDKTVFHLEEYDWTD